jgi:phage-related protein
MKEEYTRHIYYYKNYYLDFFKKLSADVKEKFIWTLKLIAMNEIVPVKFLKHIEDGTDIYRVFCFFDKGKLMILINGFRKKSKRTSIKEIEMAERIKKDYFYEKARNKLCEKE